MAYWKYLYETVCAQQRTTFGRLPNKATYDLDWFKKRQVAIDDPDNKLDPVNNSDHFVAIAMENLMVEYALRFTGASHDIEKEDFTTGVIKEGSYPGIPFV